MKKTTLTVFVFSCLALSPVWAQVVQPNIPFTRIFKVEIGSTIQLPGDSYKTPIFQRNLGKTKEQLVATYFTPYGSQGVKYDSHNLLKKKYSMEAFRAKPGKDGLLHWSNKGMYFLQNNTTIGYCLFEPLDFESYPHDATIPQIKALPVNSSYLQGKLTLIPGMTITVHEASHPNFVERYIIYRESSGYEELLLDAFYPKELDAKLEKHIAKIVNYNIETFNVHLQLPQATFTDEDDDVRAARLDDNYQDIPED